MPVRLLEAHPKVEQLRNQVAICRGPLLYCLESPDLPGQVDVSDVYIPSDVQLRPVAAQEFPFGVVALEGAGLCRRGAAWAENLYRPLGPRRLAPIALRLIPYFTWANRGPSAMSVWLPLVLRT